MGLLKKYQGKGVLSVGIEVMVLLIENHLFFVSDFTTGAVV